MRISTIICCYNYGRFLGEAIDSVLSQGFTDHEVIVVDNASTDETPAVLASYQDPRIRIVQIAENRGIAAGLNAGLEVARGEFLTFLDADDRWRPGKLRRELAIMESEPDIGLVLGDLVRFSENGYLPLTQYDLAPRFRAAPRVPTRCGTGYRLMCDCFQTLIACVPSVCWLQCSMIRRHLVQDLRFLPDRRRCPDLYYMLRVWPQVNAAYIAEPTAEIRRHGANLTADIFALEIDVCQTLREFQAEARLNPAQRQALEQRLARCCLGMGRMYLQHRRVGPAWKSIMEATRYPSSRRKAIQYLAAFPLLCAKFWDQPE